MSQHLNRRSVSAIARLEFSGLSHAQRLDAIAKCLGFETQAALMATLKKNEGGDEAGSDEAPLRAVIAFGSGVCSSLSDNESLFDEHGDLNGNILEKTFTTEGELHAYRQGMFDAEGWGNAFIEADSQLRPEHPYFKASQENPELNFVTWYEETLRQEREEDEEE